MGGARTYRTRAIVIDKTKLGEADLILTLIAEDGRQIRAVGKGARKPGSRLAARLELCCEDDLLLARGRNLDVVSEARLLEAPLGPAPGFELLSAASAVAEVARLCSFEDAEDPFVYAITRAALSILGGGSPRPGPSGGGSALDSPHLDLIVSAYVFKVLSHVGYRPDYSGCVACGDPDVRWFSARAGGLLCTSCARTVAGADEVDAATVAWLRALISSTFADLARMGIDAGTAALLAALAHRWAATHLDARLRSMEFMLGC